MILGIGSDIIDIRRIEKTIEKYGHRFAFPYGYEDSSIWSAGW